LAYGLRVRRSAD